MRETICNVASVLAILLCGSVMVVPMMIAGALADHNAARKGR